MKILEPESDRLEFKSAKGGKLPKDTWTTISAFSNSDGGKIFFGVNDYGEEIGLSNMEIDKIQKDLASLCESKFNFRVYPTISVDGNHIIAIFDPLPAAMRPLFSERRGINLGTYIRVGSTDQRATGEDIKRFAIAAQGGAELLQYGIAYKEVLDEMRIADYVEFLNSNNKNVYQDFTEVEILKKQRAVVDENTVTLFGLLAFGKKLSLKEIVSPALNIVVTQYPSVEKASEDGNLAYSDSREIDGPVLEQFEEAFDFVKSKLPVKGVIGPSGKRQDYLVVPEVAIREALANAIAHRDYANIGAKIQIDIYSNRIEIINPGRSLVPIEEIETTQSITRNPLVMNFLKENGYTEQKARGIRTIKHTIREAGLQAPVFENLGSSSFRTILYSSAFISVDDKEWLIRFRDFNLKERQLNALVYLRHNVEKGINNGTYREINNMQSVGDDKMANRELTSLVKLGIVTANGIGRYRRYMIKPDFS